MANLEAVLAAAGAKTQDIVKNNRISGRYE
jgi:hypothetical protein